MTGYGHFIKQHRLRSGYRNQTEFAKKTGISTATVSRIESEIQRPSPETLKTYAKYLTTTSYVELMVTCGYWDEAELLEDPKKEDKTISYIKEKDDTQEESSAIELLGKINLSHKDLLKEFELVIDGQRLTEAEAKLVISFIRTNRQMKNDND